MPAPAAESTFYISIITGQKDRALRGPLALWSARSILLLIEQHETEFEHIIIEKNDSSQHGSSGKSSHRLI